MKLVKSKEDVPAIPHYAVIVYKTRSIYHEGDERSRTNPGHGYPAHTEIVNTCEHYVSIDKNDTESFVKTLHFTKETNFVFFQVPGLGSMETSIAFKNL